MMYAAQVTASKGTKECISNNPAQPFQQGYKAS